MIRVGDQACQKCQYNHQIDVARKIVICWTPKKWCKTCRGDKDCKNAHSCEGIDWPNEKECAQWYPKRKKKWGMH